MFFKIKHEQKWIFIVGFASMGLFFLPLFIAPVIPFLSVFSFLGGISGFLIFPIFYVLERSIGTTLKIENDTLSIHYFLKKTTIPLSDINTLHIEEYRRRRNRRRGGRDSDYRVRMTIYLYSGEEIILTDDATTVNGVFGFIFGIMAPRPLEEVALYQAYSYLQSKLQSANCTA
ncbi:MAG: hypothetical protein MJ071_07160 [Oscillospiraceae bacterium]|nr:hypothetical protein [Oscillospiraceae bacterium]